MEDPRRAEHGQSLHSFRWKHHTRSGCRTSTVHGGPTLNQGRRHPSHARTSSVVSGPANGISPPPREFGSQPHQPHPASSRPHNPSGTAGCRNLRRGWAAVSPTALPRSHGGQYDASDTQCWPVWNWIQESASHRGSGTSGSSHSSQDLRPSLGRPSTRAPLETRFTGHRNSHRTKPRQSCTFRWRLRQQTRRGSKPLEVYKDPAPQTGQNQPANTPAPPPKMKTVRTWTSQHPEEPAQCAAAPSAAFTVDWWDSTQASEEHTPLQRSLAAGYEDRRLVPHACLPRVALPLGRGLCPSAARLHHQRAEKTWKQSVDRIWRVPLVWLLPGPTVGTRRNLQQAPRKPREDTMRAFTLWCAVKNTRRPGLPPHSALSSLQLLDLAHRWWSERECNGIHIFAAVYIHMKLQQPPPLTDLLTATAALFSSRQPHNASSLHTGWTVQQIVTEDNRILGSINFELATYTPAAWTQVFKLRLSLWYQQQSQQSQRPLLSLVPPDVPARDAQDVADVYVRDQPFTMDSRPSHVGSAWFLSCAFWICLQVAGVRLR